MVKCPECGKEVGDNNFCGKCGAKINVNICPNCENELEEDDVFCPKCGTKIDTEDSTPQKEEEKKDTKEDNEKEDKKIEEDNEEEEKKDTKEDNEKEDEKTVNDNKEEKKDIKTKEVKSCPHCNHPLDENDIDYCPECGKPIEIDFQSFNSIKYTINIKKLIIYSLISILFSFVISMFLSYIFGMVQTVDLYPIGFIITLIIVVGIFGSFENLINGGLLGIITGLVLGLLSTMIVELSSGFAFSYEMLSGYGVIVFVILGAIVGVISSKYLRKHIVKYFDIEKVF